LSPPMRYLLPNGVPGFDDAKAALMADFAVVIP
jgi:hypothetical protein